MTTRPDVEAAQWALELLLDAEWDVDAIVAASERLLLLQIDYALTRFAHPAMEEPADV